MSTDLLSDGLCHEEVLRAGVFGPCDKTAVALRHDTDGGYPYPVCAYHSRGDMVPLWDLGALLGGGTR